MCPSVPPFFPFPPFLARVLGSFGSEPLSGSMSSRFRSFLHSFRFIPPFIHVFIRSLAFRGLLRVRTAVGNHLFLCRAVFAVDFLSIMISAVVSASIGGCLLAIIEGLNMWMTGHGISGIDYEEERRLRNEYELHKLEIWKNRQERLSVASGLLSALCCLLLVFFFCFFFSLFG